VDLSNIEYIETKDTGYTDYAGNFVTVEQGRVFHGIVDHTPSTKGQHTIVKWSSPSPEELKRDACVKYPELKNYFKVDKT
jgi:hypothetical protein